MNEEIATHAIILKDIKRAKFPKYLVCRASEALNLLCNVVSCQVSKDIAFKTIARLKNAVEKPSCFFKCCNSYRPVRSIAGVKEFVNTAALDSSDTRLRLRSTTPLISQPQADDVSLMGSVHCCFCYTPVWNISGAKEFVNAGLDPIDTKECLNSILPATSMTQANDAPGDELIPQIILTLKVLDWTVKSFDEFVSSLRRCPAVGMMLCEILSNDEMLEKCYQFLHNDDSSLGKESLIQKRRHLFQNLRDQLCFYSGNCLTLFHFVSSCGDHIQSIVPYKMSITLSCIELSKSDVTLFIKVLRNATVINKLHFNDCNLDFQSIAALRDGLLESDVTIPNNLHISEIKDIHIEGYSCLGEIVKGCNVETLRVNSSCPTYEELETFIKSSGDLRVKHLTLGSTWHHHDKHDDSSQEFRLIMTAICRLSMKVTEKLQVPYLFPWRDFHNGVEEILEGIMLLQDFIQMPGQDLMVEFSFRNPPEMYSKENTKKYIQRLERSTYFQRLMEQPVMKKQDSGILTVHNKSIKLASIDSRIQTYKKKFPQIQWKHNNAASSVFQKLAQKMGMHLFKSPESQLSSSKPSTSQSDQPTSTGDKTTMLTGPSAFVGTAGDRPQATSDEIQKIAKIGPESADHLVDP